VGLTSATEALDLWRPGGSSARPPHRHWIQLHGLHRGSVRWLDSGTRPRASPHWPPHVDAAVAATPTWLRPAGSRLLVRRTTGPTPHMACCAAPRVGRHGGRPDGSGCPRPWSGTVAPLPLDLCIKAILLLLLMLTMICR